MIEIGRYNKLKAIKMTPQGMFMIEENGDEEDYILLPFQHVPEEMQEDDVALLFVFLDNDELPVASTLKPIGVRDEFCFLEVKNNSRFGSFMDWGMSKDVLIPFKEQAIPMQEGKKYLVHIYFDEKSQRLTASTRLKRFLSYDHEELKKGEEVDITIWKKTDMGVKAIINNKYDGLLFNNELFTELKIGSKHKAFIKNIREDGKIDLNMSQIAHRQIEPNAKKILDFLSMNDGFSTLTDKSNPEDIYSSIQMSKKNFKRAIGSLYKQRLISIKPTGISLTSKEES